MPLDPKQFGRNLKVARAASGLSAEALSIKAGLGKKRVSSLEEERGTPELKEICAICCALEIPIEPMILQKAELKLVFKDII